MPFCYRLPKAIHLRIWWAALIFSSKNPNCTKHDSLLTQKQLNFWRWLWKQVVFWGRTNIAYLLILFLLSAFPYLRSPHRESLLLRSTSSLSLAPTISMSSLTKPIHLLFDLPRFLLPNRLFTHNYKFISETPLTLTALPVNNCVSELLDLQAVGVAILE